AMSADHAVPSVDGGERPATPLRPGGLVSNGHVADTFKPTSSFVLSLRRSLGGLCLNWKVIGGLAAVGLSIWIMAPGLVWAALPLLLLAACPLSMLLMMRGMASGQCAAQSGGQVEEHLDHGTGPRLGGPPAPPPGRLPALDAADDAGHGERAVCCAVGRTGGG